MYSYFFPYSFDVELSLSPLFIFSSFFLFLFLSLFPMLAGSSWGLGSARLCTFEYGHVCHMLTSRSKSS